MKINEKLLEESINFPLKLSSNLLLDSKGKVLGYFNSKLNKETLKLFLEKINSNKQLVNGTRSYSFKDGIIYLKSYNDTIYTKVNLNPIEIFRIKYHGDILKNPNYKEILKNFGKFLTNKFNLQK